MYRRLCKTIEDSKYQLVDSNTNFTQIALTNPKIDYYTSIYMYNDFQKEQFDKTGSIRGIKDVVTDWLVWDFDSSDFDAARKDAMELFYRLRKNLPEEGIKLFYSGSKGIHVEVHTSNVMNVEEFKAITKQLANGLDTYDRRINDHARAFRIAGSLHPKTKRYKIPLSINDLESLSKEEIEAGASDPSNIDSEAFNYYIVSLPSEILSLGSFKEDYKPKITNQKLDDIDWSIRPKHLNNCRWALQNGAFGEGDRNNALLCLAATYKNQGDNIDICYRRLKGVCETQAKRNDCERYSDGELYNNIVSYVYNDDFNNGQFTCRKPENWLYDYCQSLGSNKCNHKEEDQLKPKKLEDIHSSFKNYVVNIEKNTIHTGIPSLDEKVFLSTGANVAIIGAAGSGKTSIALDIVNNTSKMGVHSVLASLDMHYNRLFEKTLYRVSGLSREDLYELFKNNKEQDVMQQLKKEFGNVHFFHKSAPTVSDLREYILACQEESGEKIKLVLLDYFERISSDLSDDTAASKRVAGELQDLVNDLDICLITLVQPNKMSLSSGPDTPITSYTSIKGSSYLYQSFRIILSLWRPFYNPKDFSNDRFMQMAVLKNDLGELAELEFSWDGKRGRIRELEDQQYQELQELLRLKEASKNSKDEEW